ncbi:MAG TPA: hypothetical protein VJG64_03605 [Candidatus Paceibacterota bacterium]
MVKQTLKYLILATIVIVILLWFLGGGVGKIIGNAGSFSFSFQNILSGSTSLASFKLPFQPPTLPQIPTATGDQSPPEYSPYQEYTPTAASEAGYGNPSSYAGQVALAQGTATTQTAIGQYIEIALSPGAPTPLTLSGWSLRSALSGVRAYIPEASTVFAMGRVNTVAPVRLSPGAVAIVATGPSPVGVSFAENMCTGYLGTLQPFVPPLPQSCPSPQLQIPRTASNEKRLGSACMDYIQALPPCTFPANPPSSISSACRGEIQTALSYGGCVNAHKNTNAFNLNSWRLYLARTTPLWGAQHDAIQLLDGEGNIVNVLTY